MFEKYNAPALFLAKNAVCYFLHPVTLARNKAIAVETEDLLFSSAFLPIVISSVND